MSDAKTERGTRAGERVEVGRHVTRRCPRMNEHDLNRRQPLPIPCPECYSIESYWRRIPWEPDSRTPAEIMVLSGSQDGER